MPEPVGKRAAVVVSHMTCAIIAWVTIIIALSELYPTMDEETLAWAIIALMFMSARLVTVTIFCGLHTTRIVLTRLALEMATIAGSCSVIILSQVTNVGLILSTLFSLLSFFIEALYPICFVDNAVESVGDV